MVNRSRRPPLEPIRVVNDFSPRSTGRQALWTAACAFLALSVLSCARESAASAPQRPNVLLISLDTLRADHLGSYGYERPTSPRLDALAGEGVRFENAFSSSSWTLPAHMTLLTGLPVSGHGVCDDQLFNRKSPEGDPLPVPRRGLFLSELLAGEGYRTAGFYSWKYLEPQFGFGPGFETYERYGHTFYSYEPVWTEFQRLQEAGDRKGMKALAEKHPKLFDATTPSSAEIVDAGIEWIESVADQDGDEPFFAFLHLFDVHDPYTPPAPYDRMFDPDYEGPIDGTRVTSNGSLVKPDMAPEDLAHLIALYDGEIAWVDSQLGRLFERLDELGLAENTIIAVVSDHGEEFFEHGAKTHRNNLHVETIHVPWILRWPDGLEGGVEVDVSVGLEDVAPTIYGLCGLGIMPGAAGADLSPALRGEEAFADREIWSELLHFNQPGAPRREVSLRHGNRSVLRGARGTSFEALEAFDLTNDPEERNATRYTIDAEAAQDFRLALDSLRTRLITLRGRLPLVWLGAENALDSADLAELASMGYTGVASEVHDEGSAADDTLCVDGCVWEH
jgi:arylsulfatase A-like enzyme